MRLWYWAITILVAQVGRGLWMLCVEDDEPVKRVASLILILCSIAAIYGVLTK